MVSTLRRLGNGKERGAAFLMALAAVAIVGAVSAHLVSQGLAVHRQAREEHLLAVGEDFERALTSYARFTPAGSTRRRPVSLEELLHDPRTPDGRRHLRALRHDPMTGSEQWGLLRDPQGGILGVYSLALGMPLKQTGFGKGREHFERAERYGDWIFASRSTATERTE